MKSDLYYQIEYIQNAFIAQATDDDYETDNYGDIRELLITNSKIKKYLPDFVFEYRDLQQFWYFIKRKFSTYQERREFIWGSFEKLLSLLENESNNPLDDVVSITISENADVYIKEQWDKALERRATDPEGAITTARTLVETICKYILDNLNIQYEDNIDLPKLYNITANQLNLAPQNHHEEIFKQILGGCQSVINGLGSLRNKVGDAHGKGLRYVKPHERHAKLAVNLAGTLSSFLIETFNQKQKSQI
jgi:hypothetical protein